MSAADVVSIIEGAGAVVAGLMILAWALFSK